ncbi:RNA polymerase sigma factor region1.1 domain-containing protein, partial [Chloroflexota bacterium]
MKQYDTDERELDIVSELLEKAERQGFLTNEDVFELVADTDEGAEQLDELYLTLQTAGIEIYDDKDDQPNA